MKFGVKSMKFGVKKKASNVVFYDLNTKSLQCNSSGNIIPYTKKVSDKLRIASTIPFDNLLKATVEVPKTMEEFEIDAFLVESAYKQLSIALDIDYEVSYFKVDSAFDADNWTYDVYLVDTKYLEKSYSELVEKTNYIDVITSFCFLPLVLYKTNRLDLFSNHIFVYIGDSSGTFVFFSKGVLIFAKLLVSSVHKLRVEFNQESSLELNSIEFEGVLSGKSPDSVNYRTYVDSMLNKLSSDIEEAIMYIKRVYQDLEPTCLYFGMSAEYGEEFLTFFKETFLMDVKSFNTLATISTNKGAFALADLSMLYTDYLSNNLDCGLPNFSFARRPKPLTKRESWQTVAIASGITIATLAYPVYNFAMYGYLTTRSNMLQSKYDNEVFPKAEQYRADENAMKAQIENLTKEKQAIDTEIATLRNNMQEINAWQTDYVQKSKVLDDILRLADESKVRVIKATSVASSQINNNSIVVELNLYARSQELISDFVKKLNEAGVYKSVRLDKVERISKDDDKTTAQSAVNTLGSAVDTAAQAAKNTAQNVANAAQNNATQVNPISAQVALGENTELSNRVDGELNSIVRIVVR